MYVYILAEECGYSYIALMREKQDNYNVIKNHKRQTMTNKIVN